MADRPNKRTAKRKPVGPDKKQRYGDTRTEGMYQSTEEKTATASETKRNVLRHWPKDVSSPVIPARFERATHSLEGCCSIQLSYGTVATRQN